MLNNARFAQVLPLAETTSISKTYRELKLGKLQDGMLFTLIMFMDLLAGHLFRSGLGDLEESYRAVCSEINNPIASCSRKPEK